MLLDTAFLIDLMRGDPGAISKAREFEADMVQQRISAMTVFELVYGIERSNQPAAERETVETVLESKPIHPADRAVMEKAGRISGRLAADGSSIDDGDAIIGATAIVVDEAVVTRNQKDFERIDGVRIEPY